MRKRVLFYALAVVVVFICMGMPDLSSAFVCGDANGDTSVNVSDAVYIINYVFVGGDPPDPLNAGDCNCDGSCNVSDAVAIINYVFVGGYVPCDPNHDGILDCGSDCPSTVTDYDGNVYQTVQIGDQCWMMENLKVTHYNNGDPIPNVTDNAEWSDLTTGAYCNYDNDEGNVATYGRLYNWYAVGDSRKIAPDGWHVPTDAEWKKLEMYLGMSQEDADLPGYRGTDEGGKLKEAGTVHWLGPNSGATNESGFTALPGGYRGEYGSSAGIGQNAYFWSYSEYASTIVWVRNLNYNSSMIGRGSEFKKAGLSLRCIMGEITTGTVAIDAEPNIPSPPWSLSGPNNYSISGYGDKTLADLQPGEYSITWGEMPGWITPSNSIQNLVAGETITFEGTYVEEIVTGTIVIDPSPDIINAPWSLSGPNSYAASGNGDDTIPDLEPGDYTVTWGLVSGWFTPGGSTQALAIDDTTTFAATYVQAPDSTGIVTDYDGNVYQTIKICDQWWMMENLKVTHYNNGDPIPQVTDNGEWEYLSTGAYCNYDNDEGNVSTYGRLYNWFAVDDSRNIAPDGWHVPTEAEWQILINCLGGDAIAGGKMKEAGLSHWESPNTGATNSSGFTALPGGYRDEIGFSWGIGTATRFWSSTGGTVWPRVHILVNISDDILNSWDFSTFGNSIRCVKGEPPTGTVIIDPDPDITDAPWTLSGPYGYSTSGNGDDTLDVLEPGDYTVTWDLVSGWFTPPDVTLPVALNDTTTFTGSYVQAPDSTGLVTDYDGNTYYTIKIGDQWWMMENLKVTHYRNGEAIPQVTDNSAWEALSSGAYCNYNNDGGNADVYGRLYNWYAVLDTRNIAPEGWHVPSDAEWKQLEMFLGMSQTDADATGWRGTDEGGKLKEAGTTHWLSPNTGATNATAFTALPGGDRSHLGTFVYLGVFGYFWSTTENTTDFGWGRALNYMQAGVYRFGYRARNGFSIRCVKD